MKVTTAVILAAGYGSRMLPVTAALQKDLLPILDRPIVDYIVADCLAAGVTKFIFVIRPGSHSMQDFYVGNPGLQEHLARFKKKTALHQLESIHAQATYTFVEQPVEAGYGTAVPLRCAAPHLPKDEAFIVCGGDNFLWRTGGGSDMADLVAAFERTGADGAIMTQVKPQEELFRYGVLDINDTPEGPFLRRIVEKPAPGEAPSTHINISQYILTPQLMPYVMNVTESPTLQEYLVTDAIEKAAQSHKIIVQPATGQYLDGGTVANWLEANLIVAESRPELADFLKKFRRSKHL